MISQNYGENISSSPFNSQSTEMNYKRIILGLYAAEFNEFITRYVQLHEFSTSTMLMTDIPVCSEVQIGTLNKMFSFKLQISYIE